jgi:hypothetical protein
MKRKRASWLPLMSSMRDVGPVLYGECQRNMDDDDRRLQICSAVQLLPILEAEGVSAAEQRERLHQYYDEGVAALQLYRQRKGDLRPLLALLKSDLSDGAKIAGVLMMLCGLEKTPDIAAATGRPMRTVEPHCAELRRSGQTHAVLRTPSDHTQNCVPADPTQNCVPMEAV